MSNQKELFPISKLAREFGITPRTIRYYEEMGLISSQRESNTKERYYDRKARARLKLILRGKRFGFSLAEIREMIDLYEVDPTQKTQLARTIEYGDRKIREIDAMIHELQQLKAEMLEFREQFSKLLEEKSGDEKERGN